MEKHRWKMEKNTWNMGKKMANGKKTHGQCGKKNMGKHMWKMEKNNMENAMEKSQKDDGSMENSRKINIGQVLGFMRDITYHTTIVDDGLQDINDNGKSDGETRKMRRQKKHIDNDVCVCAFSMVPLANLWNVGKH